MCFDFQAISYFFYLILIFKIYASTHPSSSWEEWRSKHWHHFIHPFPWMLGSSNSILQQTFLCGPRCESCWDACWKDDFRYNWSGTYFDGLLLTGYQLSGDSTITLSAPRAADRFPEERGCSHLSTSFWQLITSFPTSLFNWSLLIAGQVCLLVFKFCLLSLSWSFFFPHQHKFSTSFRH